MGKRIFRVLTVLVVVMVLLAAINSPTTGSDLPSQDSGALVESLELEPEVVYVLPFATPTLEPTVTVVATSTFTPMATSTVTVTRVPTEIPVVTYDVGVCDYPYTNLGKALFTRIGFKEADIVLTLDSTNLSFQFCNGKDPSNPEGSSVPFYVEDLTPVCFADNDSCGILVIRVMVLDDYLYTDAWNVRLSLRESYDFGPNYIEAYLAGPFVWGEPFSFAFYTAVAKVDSNRAGTEFNGTLYTFYVPESFLGTLALRDCAKVNVCPQY